MSGKTDVVKGRIKEAVGAVTGNDDLREEGKADQARGNAKKVVKKAVRTIKDAAEKTIDDVKGAVE